MQIGVPPTSIVGRYSCPYNNIINTHWWNTQKSGGCIVEQATHFVDLIRHLSGADIVPESIKATAVGPDMRLRQMAPHPQAEHMVQSACVSCIPMASVQGLMALLIFAGWHTTSGTPFHCASHRLPDKQTNRQIFHTNTETLTSNTMHEHECHVTSCAF